MLIDEAGFQELVTLDAIDTATGRIEIIRANKSVSEEPTQ